MLPVELTERRTKTAKLTTATVQPVKPETFSLFWAFIWFLLFGVVNVQDNWWFTLQGLNLEEDQVLRFD